MAARLRGALAAPMAAVIGSKGSAALMDDTRQQTRLEEILGRIAEWEERHAGHAAAGADCGCSLYDDVIWRLPEFDPLDPPPVLDGARAPRWTLLDGSVIDGTETRGGRRVWRIIGPGRPLRRAAGVSLLICVADVPSCGRVVPVGETTNQQCDGR